MKLSQRDKGSTGSAFARLQRASKWRRSFVITGPAATRRDVSPHTFKALYSAVMAKLRL